MISMRPLRRGLLALLLGFQAASACVPLADARLDAGVAAATRDAGRRDDAPSPHDHSGCALCVHLAQGQAPATPPLVPVATGVRVEPSPATPAVFRTTPAAPIRGARAPPLA